MSEQTIRPPQLPAAPPPVSADIYSQSIEEQFAIINDFLLRPLGAILLAHDSWVNKGLTTPTELSRHVAQRVYRSKPFFITTPIAQAIFTASQTLPEYTFTAESFPCPVGFAWLQEPICLYDGPLFSRPVLLRAFQWYLNKGIEDEHGRMPIMFDGYLVDPDRPKGAPTLHATVWLGWTLNDQYGAQDSDPVGAATQYHDEMRGVIGPVFVRFVASCLSFMEQRITIPVSHPASRATRRRLERHQDQFKPATEVQVIELRRR